MSKSLMTVGVKKGIVFLEVNDAAEKNGSGCDSVFLKCTSLSWGPILISVFISLLWPSLQNVGSMAWFIIELYYMQHQQLMKPPGWVVKSLLMLSTLNLEKNNCNFLTCSYVSSNAGSFDIIWLVFEMHVSEILAATKLHPKTFTFTHLADAFI